MQTSPACISTARIEQWLIKQRWKLSYLWWILISAVNATLVFFCKADLSYRFGSFSVSNLLLAVLVQNDLVLHGLYRLAVLVSRAVTFGRYYINTSVHQLEAVHAASASWGFVWFLIDILQHLNHLDRLVLFTTSFPLLFLWLSIILTALLPFRKRFQSAFERIHRYLSWLFLAVLVVHSVWLQFSIDLKQSPALNAIVTDPMFLMATLMITSVFLPWLTLERVDRFTADRLSEDILVLTIPGAATAGTLARISTDLIKWHSFSVAIDSEQQSEPNFQIMIEATDDWTRSNLNRIDRPNFSLWIRRVKPPGFMFSINAYSRVLIIATGTGIASALPFVANSDRISCLVWIGNHPEIYGKGIWSMLSTYTCLKIYDTNLHKEPDVSELAIQAFREFRPEAIFCVSNKAITRTVLDRCLAKGIPAYGAT